MTFRIKELKQQINKTSKQIAKDINVSPSTVDSWASGNRKPRPSNIAFIESIYGLNPGWLTGETEIMYPSDDQKRRQVKEMMTCQTEYAINTVCRLAEASESEWKTIEKIFK